MKVLQHAGRVAKAGIKLGLMTGLSLLLTYNSDAWADGRLTGAFTVLTPDGSIVAADSFEVRIFDAVNAEQLFPRGLTTDSFGDLDTGPIPAGNYRISIGGRIDAGSVRICALSASLVVKKWLF